MPVVTEIKCNTVGELLDELTAISLSPNLCDILDASIESHEEVFSGFRIIEETLSDGSKVLNFEFVAY